MKSIVLTTIFWILACLSLIAQPISTTELYKAPFASTAPIIDGVADDISWQDASWVSIDNLYLGAAYTASDFSGRYKMVWTASKLYLLAEITDDVLRDDHPNPLTNYWDDDCVEIFLDEDKSGGFHQTNYNAFAYHVSLSYDPVDGGTDGAPHLFSNDIFTRRVTTGQVSVWEFEINVYADTYVYAANNIAVNLYEGKTLGFNLAYCDNDTGVRDSFIGSRFELNADKDRGYINADVFATLELVAAIVTTTSPSAEESFNMYPNPTNDIVSIKGLLPNSRVTIYDLSGRSLKTISENISSFSIEELVHGMYVVEIKDQTGTKKLPLMVQ